MIKLHITFDIDWAPDQSIEDCLNLLKKKNIKATFFSTHLTDLNKEIIRQGHELGIHPNFLKNSSHGIIIGKVIEECLKFAPEAKYLRTHSLYQSTPLFHEIFSNFSQLKFDLSILTYKSKFIEKYLWNYDGIRFHRFNYNWEDDSEFWNKSFDWATPQTFGKLNIFNFHPIHISLNSSDKHNYEHLKQNLKHKNLSSLNKREIVKYQNNEKGTRNFFKSILDNNYDFFTLDNLK